MEPIAEGKHFRLVDETELEDVMSFLEQFLPESIKFHQTIKTYLNNRIWQFYFYVTKDWPETPVCLHFPGCTLTPDENIYQSVYVFCPTNRIECLNVLETEDVLIDWKKPLCMNFTHVAIMNQIESFYKQIGTVDEVIKGDIYVYNKQPEDLQLEELISEEVEMRELTVDCVQTIHELYPGRDVEVAEIFEKLAQAMPGKGIFRKDTGEIAAWSVHSYYGAMFSMQTKPAYRRKGYGIHLARHLTKKVMERGYMPYVVIRPANEASRNLYTKLGFEKVFETSRTTFRPRPSDSSSVDSIEEKLDGIKLEDSNDQENGEYVLE